MRVNVDESSRKVSTDDVVDSYAELLRRDFPETGRPSDATRQTSPESALAEAIVFQLLQQINLSPSLNDQVGGAGGADFLCTGSRVTPALRPYAARSNYPLVVEATSLDTEAVTNNSGLSNSVEGSAAFSGLLTRPIRQKAAAKAHNWQITICLVY